MESTVPTKLRHQPPAKTCYCGSPMFGQHSWSVCKNCKMYTILLIKYVNVKYTTANDGYLTEYKCGYDQIDYPTFKEPTLQQLEEWSLQFFKDTNQNINGNIEGRYIFSPPNRYKIPALLSTKITNQLPKFPKNHKPNPLTPEQKAYRQQVIDCEVCDRKIKNHSKYSHFKSNKHQQNVRMADVQLITPISTILPNLSLLPIQLLPSDTQLIITL